MGLAAAEGMRRRWFYEPSSTLLITSASRSFFRSRMTGQAEATNSPRNAESFGEAGRAWWLFYRPSPKVMRARSLRSVASFSKLL